MSNISGRIVNMSEDELQTWVSLSGRLQFHRRIGNPYTLTWYQLYTKLNFYYFMINRVDLVSAPSIVMNNVFTLKDYTIVADSSTQTLIFKTNSPTQSNKYIFFYISKQVSPGICKWNRYFLFEGLKYDRAVDVDLQPYYLRRTGVPLVKNRKIFFYIKVVDGNSGFAANKQYTSIVIN